MLLFDTVVTVAACQYSPHSHTYCQGIITFQNKDLAAQKSAENGFGGSFEVRRGWRADPGYPNPVSIFAHAALDVCDGGHWLFVMKKSWWLGGRSNKIPTSQA